MLIVTMKVTAMVWFTGFLAVIHFGDSSIAAVIAALASIFNAYMVIHAHGVQSEIRGDLKEVANDTRVRGQQIIELRSLSVEREKQINRLDRIADRLAALDVQELSHSVKRIEASVTANDDTTDAR